MDNKHFLIPADYGCLAILDPEVYSDFVSEDWSIQELKKHFIEQNEKGNLVAWGCGYGNWYLKVVFDELAEQGVQAFTSSIKTMCK